MKHLFAIIALLALLASCTNHSSTFAPMEGYEGDTIVLAMDLTDAVLNGITLPGHDSSFHFSFDTTPGLYYKIYYQNDSYKFPEGDSLDYENFYGSWEDVSIAFRPVPQSGHIQDSFRIVGNPRNEQIYYGVDLLHYDSSPASLARIEQEIRNDTHWFNYVANKAAPQNNRTVEEQLFLDTRWVLNERRHSQGHTNHRWKRNPRTGCYSFLLVICDEQGLAAISPQVQHIDQTTPDSHFVNPISWFHAHPHRHITLLHGSQVLRTLAHLTPHQGVYIDELAIRAPYTAKQETPGCIGSDTGLYRHAIFQQFFPAISQQYTLRNIPLIQDIQDYTAADYSQADQKYPPSARLNDHPQITQCPGSTIQLSPNRDYISIINPGNAGLDHPKKESNGIKTRVGFTYGKYRGKIKFPPMLNQQNIWNGLTYAFWLIYQDDHPWNLRRPSYHGGYLEKNDESPNPTYLLRNKYSEIDIEIVKASPYWPEDYYRSHSAQRSAYQPMSSSDVCYCCTNWDLACPEPRKFASGITHIQHNDQTFDALRWYDTYKALTTKHPIPNSIFSRDYYYYEIEWRPTEIIWRLGPDPQHMQVVGYMNDRYTAIPNNQMLCIVTQEYHYSEWWPPIVFEQGLIPFNASDIEGRVYSITVE